MDQLFDSLQFRVNGGEKFQTMFGFGVNINSKYWEDGHLINVMRMLLDDCGASMYRVDIFGKTDWVDPKSELGREAALSAANIERVHADWEAQSGLAMMKYLNERGIEPYLTCSGDVPKWMLADDGVTLKDFEAFTDIQVALLDWLINKNGVKMTYFCALNETDIGSPEGPTLLAEGAVEVYRMLDRKLKATGLDHIKLVAVEQAIFNADYVKAFVAAPELAPRVGAFSLHQYRDMTAAQYQEIFDTIKGTPYEGTPVWMGEYGDLDMSGEKEWYIGWKSMERAFDFVNAGFSSGMQWDAYDNHHDHDGAWTIYGLIRYSRRIGTRKKRFFSSKQLYKFVRPGFVRLGVHADPGVGMNACLHGSKDGVRLLAFADPAGAELTIVGMNASLKPCEVTIELDGLGGALADRAIHYHLTTANDNCTGQPDVDMFDKVSNWSGALSHITQLVPPQSIFTFTTL